MAADAKQKIAAEIQELQSRIVELKTALQKLPDADSPDIGTATCSEQVATIFRSVPDTDTQKSLLEAVIETMDVGVSLCDQNGVFLIYNSESRRMGGVEVMDGEENWSAHYGVFYPDEVTAFPTGELPLVRALQGETVRDAPIFLRNSKQTKGLHISVSAIPFIDPAGDASGAVLVARDITEFKQIEQEHARRATALAIAQREVEAQKNLLEAVLESIDIGVSASNKEGDFVIFNPAARRMLGVGPVSGVENWTPEYGCFRIDGTPYPAEELPLARALRGETVHEEELYIRNPEIADDVLLSVSATPFINPPGDFDGAVCFFRDITAQTIAQQKTQDNERRFRAFMDNVPAITFIKDSEGKYVYGNRNFFDYHPVTEEELERAGKTDLELTSPEAAEVLQQNDHHVLNGQTPLHIGEQLINFQGKSTWFSVYKFLLTHASGAKFVGGIAVDITERRTYERQMIADEQLLRKLIDLQEKELFMVSHDIHDGFVQEVFGAKMLCEALVTQLDLPADSPSHSRFQAIIEALSRATADARRLISELRPLVIDEDGIVEAIRYLISDSSIAQEIKITFTQNIRTPRYDSMLEGNLFRIVQEALNNARRHSEAAAVSIHLEEQGSTIRLTIQDNGIGFDLNQIDPSRFGIRGIRERARLFGGTAKISSQPGTGTKIIVEVPRELKPEPDH